MGDSNALGISYHMLSFEIEFAVVYHMGTNLHGLLIFMGY